MTGQVLHLMELQVWLEVGVFVCFSLALTRRSRWFRGRLYAIKGRSEKAQSLQHQFSTYSFIHTYNLQFHESFHPRKKEPNRG